MRHSGSSAWLLLTATVLVLLVLLTRAGAGQAPRPLLVTGGTLIDGLGGPPVPDAVVLVEGGRITAVGSAAEIDPPADARVIEAAGKFIIPGLIDAHVHYRDWLGEMFLAYGVTSVFDLGDPSDWILALREAERRGLLRGPRLYVSANLLDGHAMTGRASMGGGGPRLRSRRNETAVEDAEDARREARALIARGVDFIKVYQQLSLEQLAAITDEAHRAGLKVFGHTYDVLAAGDAGLDVVTHLWGVAASCMSPEELRAYHAGEIPSPYPYLRNPSRAEVIRGLVARGMYVNPLIVNEHAGVTPRTDQHRTELKRLVDQPELAYIPPDAKLGLLVMFDKVRNYASRFGSFPPLDRLPPDAQDQFRTGYLAANEFLRDFVRAGGKLLVGSDSAGASIVPGLSVHHELRFLVDAGATPMQALQAATKVAGDVVAGRDKLGTIESGARGDLVILDADPLADINNTLAISTVIKDGTIVDTKYRRDYTSPIPYPIEEYSSSYLPLPVLEDIQPKTAPVGSSGVRLTVNGAGFALLSHVTVGSRPVPTRMISNRRLEADIPADLLDSIGTLPVRVVNPRPGGRASNPYGFVVAPPAGDDRRKSGG